VYSMVVGVLKCFRMSKTQDVVETHALRTHVFLALASLVSLRTLTIPVNTSFGAESAAAQSWKAGKNNACKVTQIVMFASFIVVTYDM
jgi:hypothetical protein